jgi:hypothetical protein
LAVSAARSVLKVMHAHYKTLMTNHKNTDPTQWDSVFREQTGKSVNVSVNGVGQGAADVAIGRQPDSIESKDRTDGVVRKGDKAETRGSDRVVHNAS